MNEIRLSKKGNDIIKLYEEMAVNGINRTDGKRKENVYNDFQLREFRNLCQNQISSEKIKTVLDYGGGGSDWNAPNFDPKTNQSAKDFFKLQQVDKFEPARGLMQKKKADCVVCMDVLEHIFIQDIPKVIDELFALSKKLLVVNVACYKAAALLPNGENAHITVRSPDWWKGVFDAISIGYENIEVMLICSNTFTSGVIFESFKFGDWASTEGFTTTMSFKTFQPI